MVEVGSEPLPEQNGCSVKETKDDATTKSEVSRTKVQAADIVTQLETLKQQHEAEKLAMQRRIDELERENSRLRSGKAASTASTVDADTDRTQSEASVSRAGEGLDEIPEGESAPVKSTVEKLDTEHIERYSRQLLLQDGFGVDGQCKLLSSSVLVVGAGGIGSTVLLYLAASGVGSITVVDYDQVEKSNLHRQVLHQEGRVGMNKAVSACRAMKALNPSIRCTPIQTALTHENAFQLIREHDCVVDACDNPLTRYLVNDACVLAQKPLVSGSAMGTEGQMTVYNYPPGNGSEPTNTGGPCYRCLYPKPNKAEGCKSCSDNGVLGPVPGLIGILQSLETLKILTGFGTVMHDRLVMYDSLRCSFMSIKKPPRSKRCPVSGQTPIIQSMEDSQRVTDGARGPNIPVGTTNDVANAASANPAGIQLPSLPDDLSVSCQDYKTTILDKKVPHLLLDVRVERQFDMCSLPGAVNIPLASLSDRIDEVKSANRPIFCLCRRGIFSVEATKLLNKAGVSSVQNITGGLLSWSKEVDSNFPIY